MLIERVCDIYICCMDVIFEFYGLDQCLEISYGLVI